MISIIALDLFGGVQEWFSTNIPVVAGIGSIAGLFATVLALLWGILARKLNLKLLLGGVLLLLLFGVGAGLSLLGLDQFLPWTFN